MKLQLGSTLLELVEGDITTMETDAIVNAANDRLAHGGGVAGVISRIGGPTIQRESNEWVRAHGKVPTGHAAITSGGQLKARYVIHAVGPVYDGTAKSAELLGCAVRAALRLADDRGLRSIALPAISTGIFGYPMKEAARVILLAIAQYLGGPAAGHQDRQTCLERIVVCLFAQPAYHIFASELEQLRPRLR
jgi:O-acetyl-ADP-ribose deacetylase (regulator of RNase III)